MCFLLTKFFNKKMTEEFIILYNLSIRTPKFKKFYSIWDRTLDESWLTSPG